MSLTGTNGSIDPDTGEKEYESFQKPLFQTFGMFVGSKCPRLCVSLSHTALSPLLARMIETNQCSLDW